MKLKFVLLILVFLVAGCCGLNSCCTPDKCPDALEGFAIYQPVIKALEQYKSDHDIYPKLLEQLIPEYIQAIPLPKSENATGLEYTSDGSSFTLRFGYIHPGYNKCAYFSTEKKWSCAGAF